MSLFPTIAERIEHQKYIADGILDKLFPIDPYCICAGGAPRDWYLGKVASDLDIFIHVNPNLTLTKIDQMLKAVGLEPESHKAAHNLPEWYKKNPDLRCVYNLKVQDVPVQIMVMLTPTFSSVLPNFPLSICKIWYKNYKIVADKQFKRSVAHNVIVKTSEIYNNADAYVKKIIDKFPNMKYHANWEWAAAEIMDREI